MLNMIAGSVLPITAFIGVFFAFCCNLYPDILFK